MNKAIWRHVGAFAIGAIGTIAVQRGSLAAGIQDSFFFYAVGAAVFLLIPFAVRTVLPSSTWTSVPLTMAGIAVGSFADATYDFFVHGADQSLWPVGVVLWWTVGIVPLVAGYLVARRVIEPKRSPDP
jgi:hypothetical protein